MGENIVLNAPMKESKMGKTKVPQRLDNITQDGYKDVAPIP